MDSEAFLPYQRRLAAVRARGDLGAWRYLPLSVVMLAGALTSDPTRHRKCAEVMRLSRRDAAGIPSYYAAPPSTRR